MKQQAINQEILLITDARFSSRLFCRKDTRNNEEVSNSLVEEMEKACWDGMLNELLPELAGHPSNGRSNFIWNIVTGAHFLCISMGPCPMPEKNKASIDPYFFLSSIVYN